MARDSRKTLAFWDSSALVPLCIQQTASARVSAQFRVFSPVVWWGTRIEIESAICRLHREQAISDAAKKYAASRLESLTGSWREILPAEEVRVEASKILETHALRAGDSLQLAAALVWCDQRPARRTFVCGDRHLASAARATGFTVIDLA